VPEVVVRIDTGSVSFRQTATAAAAASVDELFRPTKNRPGWYSGEPCEEWIKFAYYKIIIIIIVFYIIGRKNYEMV